MHILKDENGNPIPHGGHDHDHGHSHEHHHHDPASKGDKTLALLSYMYDHNVQHTEELLGMADQVEEAGKTTVAAKIREAAAEFNKGNDLLHEALHQYED